MLTKVTPERIRMDKDCRYPNLYKKMLEMWIETTEEASNNFDLFEKTKQDLAFICVVEAGGEIDWVKIKDFTYLDTPYYSRIRDEIRIRERHVPKIEEKRYRQLINKWWLKKYSATILFLVLRQKYDIKEDNLALYLGLRQMFPFISFDDYSKMRELAIESYDKFLKNRKFLQAVP